MKHATRLLIAEVVLLLLSLTVASVALLQMPGLRQGEVTAILAGVLGRWRST